MASCWPFGLVLLLMLSAGCAEETRDVSPQRVLIQVTESGFAPSEIQLKRGQPAVLEFTRTEETECLKAVRMPWMKSAIDLPIGKPVGVEVQTTHAGTFTYACWMNMVTGRVVIHE